MTKDDLKTGMELIKTYCGSRRCEGCEMLGRDGTCKFRTNELPTCWEIPETKSKAQLEIESLQAKKAEFDKEYDEKMARLKEEV